MIRLIIIALAMGGCVSSPAFIDCKGKGSITGTENVIGYAGAFNITADCGEGFRYEQRKYAPKEK